MHNNLFDQLAKLQVLDNLVMLDLLGGEDEDIHKFQIKFLQQAKVSLKKIQLAIKEGEGGSIKEQAHYLKTSAKAVGAERCALLLQTLEDEHNSDRGHLIALYKQLHSELTDVVGLVINK